MKWQPGLIRFRIRIRFRFRFRYRRTVLDALAHVGPAGMTPNSLEVTTDLAEPLLNATLVDLMAAGLVAQRVDDGMLTDLHDKHYLLAEHAVRKSRLPSESPSVQARLTSD